MSFWNKHPKSAAVLGCGPTGLFAAHALIQNGWDVTIYSKKRKSHMYGAQYLHAPIPGLTPADADPITIKYRLEGSVADYSQKVYGSMPVHASPEALRPEHYAWDIRAAYDKAWELYQHLVIDQEVSSEFLGWAQWSGINPTALQQRIDPNRFQYVLSSIPAPQMCYSKHIFHSATVWAMGDAPDRGQYVPYRPQGNTVECNGTRDVGWYRAANVFGHATVEWPGNRKPPLPAIAAVTKPVYTDCICYRGADRRDFIYIPIGRYGTWEKSVLTHHSYTQAAQL